EGQDLGEEHVQRRRRVARLLGHGLAEDRVELGGRARADRWAGAGVRPVVDERVHHAVAERAQLVGGKVEAHRGGDRRPPTMEVTSDGPAVSGNSVLRRGGTYAR